MDRRASVRDECSEGCGCRCGEWSTGDPRWQDGSARVRAEQRRSREGGTGHPVSFSGLVTATSALVVRRRTPPTVPSASAAGDQRLSSERPAHVLQSLCLQHVGACPLCFDLTAYTRQVACATSAVARSAVGAMLNLMQHACPCTASERRPCPDPRAPGPTSEPPLLLPASLLLCTPLSSRTFPADQPTPTMSKPNPNDDQGKVASRTRRQMRIRTKR